MALAFLMLLCVLPLSAAAANPFVDVPDDVWYKKAVDYVYENGLFNGTSSTTFTPSKAMTRGMFVQVLANMTTSYDADYYKARDSYYEDVYKKSWMSAAVRWASDARIVNGTSVTRFSPDNALTREQMAVMLFNYAEKSGNSVDYSTAKAETFSDYTSVSSWAKQAIAWAVDNGVINGTDGLLNPKGTATRAQVAQVFMNAKELLVKKTIDIGTPEPTKANIAMLFSRSIGLDMGKLALECNFDNPVYISGTSYPNHNYRVIGLKDENEIAAYLSSFMTSELALGILAEAELHEKNGSVYITIPPHGMTTGYNADSVKIVSGSEGVYAVSIDIYFFIPTTYGGTSEMNLVYENGEYKIAGYNDYYEVSNPVAIGDWLPHYLEYKPW